MSSATRQAVSIRHAEPADLPRIEEMLAAGSLPTDGVAAHVDDFLIAEHGGEAVGAIGLETHGVHGLLRSAVVAPAWQGKGIGRALVEELLSLAKARGIASLHLLTTTAENYFPAFGFSPVTREAVPAALLASEEFRGACPDTATVMKYDLEGRLNRS
jgi:N-acetylglutamate synthase-like GNAT family acetyltransferase